MGAWATGAWATGAWRGTAWATDESEPLVVVPDVVGLTQAAATLAIVGAGLLTAISTAYSASVAVGLVISQSPAATTLVDSGDLVSFVVSLGPQPVITVTTPRNRTIVVSRHG